MVVPIPGAKTSLRQALQCVLLLLCVSCSYCASTYGVAVSNISTAVAALQTVLANVSDVLLMPGTTDYLSELGNFWNVANQEIHPKLILRPRTSEQAATIIKVLTKYETPFGIRSGGHMPNKGFNTSPDVVIATTLLNSEMSYPSSGVIRVGPGLRWGDVYTELLTVGATAVGGRYEAVGVAGYLMGGGISHLSNSEGFAADMIVNMEVVLAFGEVVNANATSNEDLFWALKGGGNSFGLVTQFDIKYVEQPDGVWGGIVAYSSDHLDDLLAAVQEWQLHNQTTDLKQSVGVEMMRGAIVGTSNSTVVMLVMYYGAPVEYPETMRGLTDIPHLSSTLRVTTHLNLSQELAEGGGNTLRQAFYAISYKSDADLNRAAHDEFFTSLAKTNYFDDEKAFAVYTLQPIGPMLQQAPGQHPMDIDPDGGPYIWVDVSFQYSDASLDDTVLNFSTSNHAATKALAEKAGKSVDYIYLNDAGSNQDVLPTYGSSSYSKMLAVREKYDPNLVFTKLCRGGYKLKA